MIGFLGEITVPGARPVKLHVNKENRGDPAAAGGPAAVGLKDLQCLSFLSGFRRYCQFLQ